MNPYLLVAVAVLLGLLGLAGWRLDALGDKLAEAELALEVSKENERVVTKYIDRVVTVEKRIPGAVRHIISLCDKPLPGAGHPDAAAATDARDRRIAGLAADAAACRQNSEQLSALQEVLRPQVSP